MNSFFQLFRNVFGKIPIAILIFHIFLKNQLPLSLELEMMKNCCVYMR